MTAFFRRLFNAMFFRRTLRTDANADNDVSGLPTYRRFDDDAKIDAATKMDVNANNRAGMVSNVNAVSPISTDRRMVVSERAVARRLSYSEGEFAFL